MIERPILFSGPMVRAILEGRKTQTRRVVKPAPEMVTNKSIVPWDGPPETLKKLMDRNKRGCPYGVPGDRLWVRETWDFRFWNDNTVMIAYASNGEQREVAHPLNWCPTIYTYSRQRPSIFMPRWASRILLEVVSVRVERLNAITPADAIAEGVGYPRDDRYAAVENYKALWDFLNAKKAPWALNPWVWVVEFRMVQA